MPDYSEFYQQLVAEGMDEHEAAAVVDRQIALDAARRKLQCRGINREPTAREVDRVYAEM